MLQVIQYIYQHWFLSMIFLTLLSEIKLISFKKGK